MTVLAVHSMERGIRPQVVFTWLSALLIQSLAQSSLLSETNPFDYLNCSSDSSASAYALSSSIGVPNPYTVCFEIRARNCSDPTSSCCKTFDVVNFILDVDSNCDGGEGAIIAAFNDQPLSGLSIQYPTAPIDKRVLTIPGIAINASTVGSSGADICFRLLNSTRCPFLSSLAEGQTNIAWAAALLSSDTKCCPTTRGVEPPRSPTEPPLFPTPPPPQPPPPVQSPVSPTQPPPRISQPPPAPSRSPQPPPPSKVIPPSPKKSPPPSSSQKRPPTPAPRPSPRSSPAPRRSQPPSPSPRAPPPKPPSPLSPRRPPPPAPKPPQSRPPSPRPASCQTCLVWDVQGPDGTPNSTLYNFLTNNSCLLVDIRPEDMGPERNCCDLLASHQIDFLTGLRQQGLILDGFDKPTCERTSMRFCGTFANKTVGQQLASQVAEDDWVNSVLRPDFGVTDDTCPMALINSTIRLYGAPPGTTKPDTQCAPINLMQHSTCSDPNRLMWEYDYLTPFPPGSCDDTPGIMPFAVDPFMEVKYGNRIDTFCINIRPVPVTHAAKDPCNSTAIGRMSFWLWDSPDMRSELRSVYLMLTQNGTLTKRIATRSWGQEGDNALTITRLGLDTITVRTMAPKVCFDVNAYTNLWSMTVDPLGFLWSAVYDGSGKCCPTYYSNRF